MGSNATPPGTKKKGCAGPGIMIAIGALLAVAGGVVGIGLVIYGGANAVTDFNNVDTSVDVGTTATANLDEGSYYVYLQGDDLFLDAEGFTRSPAVVDPTVTVTDPSGTTVSLGDIGIDVTTSGLGGTDRIAFASFDADSSGEYTIEVSENDPPVASVGIGPAIDLWGSLGSLAVGLAIGAGAAAVGGLLVVIGIVWAIVRYSRRPKNPPGFGPPGYGPPGNGPPGYGPPGYGAPGQGAPGWAPPQGPQAPGWGAGPPPSA